MDQETDVLSVTLKDHGDMIKSFNLFWITIATFENKDIRDVLSGCKVSTRWVNWRTLRQKCHENVTDSCYHWWNLSSWLKAAPPAVGDSPCLFWAQTGWSQGQWQGTRPPQLGTSGSHLCCTGSKCGRWPSSSAPWWTRHGCSWQRPEEPSGGDPLFGSEPLGKERSRKSILLTPFFQDTKAKRNSFLRRDVGICFFSSSG